MEAKAQIEAFKSGVRSDAVEDAVYLAVREVEKSGDEVDEDTIREALKNVLKRHPSWKNTEKQKRGSKSEQTRKARKEIPRKLPWSPGK